MISLAHGEDASGAVFLSVDGEARRARALNAGTGVVPAHRGRGPGLLVERHPPARAAEAGAGRNDATASIRA